MPSFLNLRTANGPQEPLLQIPAAVSGPSETRVFTSSSSASIDTTSKVPQEQPNTAGPSTAAQSETGNHVSQVVVPSTALFATKDEELDHLRRILGEMEITVDNLKHDLRTANDVSNKFAHQNVDLDYKLASVKDENMQLRFDNTQAQNQNSKLTTPNRHAKKKIKTPKAELKNVRTEKTKT